MKIVLTGGGTLGSVSPLVGIWQALKAQDSQLEALFIGTKTGPEKDFLKQYSLDFKTVPAGKFRRYFSLKNLLIPFVSLIGFLKALRLLAEFKPNLIVSAGGFVAIPVILAGKLLGSKILIHQLDIKPTLSNKLVSGLADKITVTFEKSLNDYNRKKTEVVGSLLRQEINEVINQAKEKNILVLGGGTGALAINQLVAKTAPFLPKDFQIIHMTGKGKKVKVLDQNNYHQFEFLDNDYYQKIAESSLVISRAGLSTLLELSFLKKPAIVIPIPSSHQEDNAEYLAAKKACFYFKQNELTPKKLAEKIKEIIDNKEQLSQISDNIFKIADYNGAKKIVKIINNLK